MRNQVGVSRTEQAKGKLRRFYKSHFRRKKVWESIGMRRGECDRCGECCKILLRCPFLVELDDTTYCRIYEKRFSQCRLYPIEPKDIREIGGKCTYDFEMGQNLDD
ncbi:MAG: hypothetical protein AB1756_09985 [Acidobacteriota bacterium]